jgi:hypothetical protein
MTRRELIRLLLAVAILAFYVVSMGQLVQSLGYGG